MGDVTLFIFDSSRFGDSIVDLFVDIVSRIYSKMLVNQLRIRSLTSLWCILIKE